jgi:hypothetical protein
MRQSVFGAAGEAEAGIAERMRESLERARSGIPAAGLPRWAAALLAALALAAAAAAGWAMAASHLFR